MLAKQHTEMKAKSADWKLISLFGEGCRRKNIHGMNDHFMRSLQNRYEGIYDWQSLLDIIPKAETANAVTMIQNGFSLESCLQWIWGPWVWTHLNIYGKYDWLLECLQVSYTAVTAITMMRSKQKTSSIPPCQHFSHPMIWDFTKSTATDSANYVNFIFVAGARSDSRMLDTPEVEIWSTVSLSIFLLSLPFTSLLVWTMTQYKWHRHGLLPPSEMS